MDQSPDTDLPATGLSTPGDVIDAHLHVVTVGLLEEYLASMDDPPPGFREALARRQWGRKADVLPKLDPAQAAEWYCGQLEEAGVAAGVVMSLAPDNQWLRDFLASSDGRLVGCARIDPRRDDAVELLNREYEAGFRGVKLLPVNIAYSLADPACAPFFDRLDELGLPATIHYGVSVDAGSDLRFADPIDLSPVARDHPNVNFVIAHFGAGWFNGVLRLAYQCKNVLVDTSGTNNWSESTVPALSLPEVFERALTALGPERVLFGTDSNTAAPYRRWLAYQQRRTLEEMGVSEAHRGLILRGNAARLYGL
ncbi:MAG TPA: amidohydrolase family protein [Coriobacteriia bacterium]|nr:amidohydrolase family protein [Coriobacteriia bacterium]